MNINKSIHIFILANFHFKSLMSEYIERDEVKIEVIDVMNWYTDNSIRVRYYLYVNENKSHLYRYIDNSTQELRDRIKDACIGYPE